MARAIAPDVNNPYPGPPKGTGGGNGGSSGGNNKARGFMTFDAFMPGQLGGLATDLATFGGTVPDWKDYLRETTMPTMVPVTAAARNRWGRSGGNGNGGGGGKGDGTGGNNNGGDGGNNGGFEPTRPRNKMAPQTQALPVQSGFLNVGPMGQQVPPTMGLLGRPRQTFVQGPLPPEIQMMISSQRR